MPTRPHFSENGLIPVITIVGPTATGKSKLAFNLAKSFGGEIINGDSRQVYRHMDIGTAKPPHEQRSIIPHHLIDIVDPDEPYSLALYLEQARKSIQDIHNRGKLPFLVGGSGQYIWSVLEGFKAPQVAPNISLREKLEAEAIIDGHTALWQRLQKIDPEAASRIDARNVRRVIRGLEVYYETGIPFSQAQAREEPPYSSFVIGLTLERTCLYKRIDKRTDDMIENGWPEEVAHLLENGYYPELPSMSSLGYRDIAACIAGDMALDQAIIRIKSSTHRFARNQYAWFRLNDPRIHWLDADVPEALILAREKVSEFLSYT